MLEEKEQHVEAVVHCRVSSRKRPDAGAQTPVAMRQIRTSTNWTATTTSGSSRSLLVIVLPLCSLCLTLRIRRMITNTTLYNLANSLGAWTMLTVVRTTVDSRTLAKNGTLDVPGETA